MLAARMAMVSLLALSLAGCGGGDQAQPDTAGNIQRLSKGGSGDEAPFQASERLIIREAEVSLQVNDVSKAVQDTADITKQHDGWVQSSSISGENGQGEGTTVIRVPAESFEQVMEELRRLGIRVLSEEVSSEDVTEEYVDLQARLRNLEASEAQLRSLMERAETIEDVLAVQQELRKIREEIERLTGRMQFLKESAAESRITVRLVPAGVQGPLVRQGWSALDTTKGALQGLISTLQIIADVAIYALIFAPVWVPLAALFVWWYRRYGGPNTQRRPQQSTPPAGGDDA